jgi:hypothetical protein
MYSVRVITSLDEFVALKDKWNALWLEAAFRTPYQRWEWNYSWIVNTGQDKTLYVVVVVDSNAKLCGIAPLRVSFSFGLLKVLSCISHEATAYPDFILHKGSPREVLFEIITHLKNSNYCSSLDLKITEPSSTLELLRDAFKQAGWRRMNEDGYTKRLRVYVGYDYEIYLSTLSRAMRTDIRYADRKLRKNFKVDFNVKDGGIDFEESMAEVLRLYALRWGGDPRTNFPTFRAYYRATCASGGSKFFVLTCDGNPVGAVAASLLDDTIYVELTGFDFSIFKVDLGKIFYSNLFQWAIENGYSYIDFMTGEHEYKYRYNPEEMVKWKISAYKSDVIYLFIANYNMINENLQILKKNIARIVYPRDGILRKIIERLKHKNGT